MSRNPGVDNQDTLCYGMSRRILPIARLSECLILKGYKMEENKYLPLSEYKFLSDGTMAPKEYDETWLGWEKVICEICGRTYLEYFNINKTKFDLICPVCDVSLTESDQDDIREEIDNL